MGFGVGPLLERHRVFHSRDADETRAFLGRKDYRFDPAWRRDRELDARLNAVYMPSLYIAYIHYGTVSVALTAGRARKDHLIQLPLRGHLETRIEGHSIACRNALRLRRRDVKSANSYRARTALESSSA
jgi:AraC-binding-like domain